MVRPAFEDEGLFGVGEAAGGWIRAVVADGRLANLELSPQLMRRGGMDSSTLAVEVTKAVNAALDDLVRQVTAGKLDTAAQDQVNATFTRAIDEITADLERAERRLYRH